MLESSIFKPILIAFSVIKIQPPLIANKFAKLEFLMEMFSRMESTYNIPPSSLEVMLLKWALLSIIISVKFSLHMYNTPPYPWVCT